MIEIAENLFDPDRVSYIGPVSDIENASVPEFGFSVVVDGAIVDLVFDDEARAHFAHGRLVTAVMAR